MKSIAVSPRHIPRKSSPQVCWRRDLAVPHESLWGRWNKLELFNRATHQDIQEYLRDPEAERERAWGRSADPGDSRVQGVLDGGKLTDLSAPGFARTRGVIADYFPAAEKSRSERDMWTADDFRYCPRCLKAGVHVTYFQFRFVERCPVHGVELRTRCPSCRKSIEYRHGRERCGTRFACSCRRPLWNWAKSPVSNVDGALKRGHAKAGDWVRAAMQPGQMLHFPWKYDPHNDERGKKADRVQSFATLVAHAHPELGRLPANFRRDVERRIVTTRVNGGQGRATNERTRLVATYKAICRYYRRRLLRRHHAAIKLLEQKRNRPLYGELGELDWTVPFAPVASALIVWRMYWEGIKSPVELTDGRRRYIPFNRIERDQEHWTITLQSRFYRLVSSPQWKMQKQLSSEVRVRWFAEVCLRVFDECLLRIYQEFQKKAPVDGRHHWQFTTKSITGLTIPFMLPRRENDGSATLFWIFPYRRAVDVPFLAKAIEQPPRTPDFEAHHRAEQRFMGLISGSFSRFEHEAGRASE